MFTSVHSMTAAWMKAACDAVLDSQSNQARAKDQPAGLDVHCTLAVL